MKCKGFTLVELLAVIVILGALFIIVIPEILFLINNNKKEALLDSARMMVKSADSYYTLYLGKRPQIEGGTSVVTLNQLVAEELIEMVTDPLNNNSDCDGNASYVIIKYQGNRKYDYYVTLDCNGYGLLNVLSSNITIEELQEF